MRLTRIPVKVAIGLLPRALQARANKTLEDKSITSLVVLQGPGMAQGKGTIWDMAASGLFFGLVV